MIAENANQYGLSRTIPETVKREVRQKYGFGCVVCGLGIYQYDHFDPEFKDAHEHNPDGIILLCSRCHGKKTTKALPKEIIAEHIKNPAALKDGYSSEILHLGQGFPELIFAGTTYTNCMAPIFFQGRPLLKFSPPDIEGGPLNFSAFFYDSDGNNTLTIVNNEWRASNESWDVEVTGGVLTIREGPGKINLVINFTQYNKIVIERIVSTIGSTKLVGNENQLQLFNVADGTLKLTLKNVRIDSAVSGIFI